MKYSVITINYNNKDGLQHTIESVVKQTCKDYEYIIIDGGSTDGSVDVIKEHADDIAYWVSEKDNGIYHAMNKGIRAAKGEYCIFMNSGDAFFNSQVIEEISQKDLSDDIIVGSVYDSTNKLVCFNPPAREISLYHLYSSTVPHQGSFIKTSLLKKYLYDEALKIVADWKFFVQVIIFDNCSIRYVDTPVALYDRGGISSTNTIFAQEEKEKILSQLFPPRILHDYLLMKASECKTQSLTPQLKTNYGIDRLLYKIGTTLIKLRKLVAWT